MRRTLAIAVYEHRVDSKVTWWPLVPRAWGGPITGTSEVRMREEFGKLVREALRLVDPAEHELWDAPPGLRLHRLHLDLATQGPNPKRVAGSFPLILEPRWFTDERQRLLAYHPRDRSAWFDADDLAEAEVLAPHFARKAWAALDADQLEELKVTGKDRLLVVSYSVEPTSLLDRLKPEATERGRAGLGRATRRVLGDLAVDQTARAIDRTLPIGEPREPYRGQLGRLLGGDRPRSTVLIGRPGSGRSTLLARWVDDRLAEDGWFLHRNADRIHRVWRLSGKRLIAGMQYFGDWEARCLDVAEDARKHRGILWFDDLHLFGRLGITRQSERSFADFFRGPVQRGELVVIGTATREQLARLEDDAPAFAGLFTRIAIEPTTAEQTRALLLAEVRRLEREHPVAIHPFVPRTVAELASALWAWTAAPGAAVELLRKLVAWRLAAQSTEEGGERLEIGPRDAVTLAARETGLPEHLITLDQPLDPAAVEAHFAARVIGQDEAVAVATEVVLKVRAGLTDASRPLGVYLFTGPTGTGKTELATALAEYLYGDPKRLLRFDMSELSGPDAVARLIGDRFAPEGLLTQRIREQPFAVVLLDEIEKAHPAVLALLLQLFDEGRLTDAAGDAASFRHAVIVMTSNLGAKVAAPIGFGDGAAVVMGDIARAVREFFPPELWNRIDQVVRFRPLTPEVAARVVDKELAKLLGRRGLRERNVFVYAGRAIRERAVAQAFDSRYGARTVKRWLEDHVATRLAEALTTAPPARMTVARLREDGATVGVDLEVLAEVESLPGDYPMAELRELSASALVPHAEAMADEIDQVLASRELIAQEEAARTGPRAAEVRYYAEGYRDELLRMRTILVGQGPPARAGRTLEESDDELTHDLEVHDRESVIHQSSYRRGYVESKIRFDRRSLGRGAQRFDQRTGLEALARARLLIDHVGELADPDAHVVTVELAAVGRGVASWSLARVLASLPHDELAVRTRDGRVTTTTPVAGAHVVHAVLVVRELFAAPALVAEHGSHVFQSLAGEPEIVRVSVTPGPAEPRARVRAHEVALAGFEAAVAAGQPGINPEPLLPVVRVLSIAPAPRPGQPMTVDVEDFITGFTGRLSVPNELAAINGCREIRWSRVGGRR